MEIVNKKIDELIPYKNNPRINEESVEYVANSIKEFGMKVPLVIDKNNVIVTGHTRYLACKQLGIKEVPCIISSDLTDKQNNMYRVVDNKVSELSRWDYDLLDKEIEELEELDYNLEQFGFENEDESMEFIEEMLGSGIAGDEAEQTIDKISINFNIEDEVIVNNVITEYGKEKILDKVIEKIEEE